MSSTPVSQLKELVLEKLRKELPQGIFYHAPEHTLDVMNRAIELAGLENFTADETNLVSIAALFHDTGYIIGHQEHELSSCKIARSILLAHGYSENDIERICELIMATKIPQTPLDKLAMVLCDADLDYLGRDDFFILGKKLQEEMLFFGSIKTEEEWQQLQVNFLQSHHYFTKSEKLLREGKKQEHLTFLKRSFKL